MIAIEHELITCPTCQGAGMLDGDRCPDCKGRGVVRRRPGDVPDEAAATTATDTPLAELTKKELLAIAGDLGLELPTKATNAVIVEAIETERQRLADEAAAATETAADASQTPSEA